MEKKKNLQKLIITFAVFLGIALVFFAIAIGIAIASGEWRGIMWFLNGNRKFTLTAMIVGLSSAAVFGFIDNAGMFFGMDALKPYLPGGQYTQAGWSNTVSSVIGSLISTAVGVILKLVVKFEGGPIYSDILGILSGSIAGIYIPKWITGKE